MFVIVLGHTGLAHVKKIACLWSHSAVGVRMNASGRSAFEFVNQVFPPCHSKGIMGMSLLAECG